MAARDKPKLARSASKHRARREKPASKLTISDVACAAKVSTATVSRVLNNSGAVTDSTRKHVLRVIAELQYEPNASAKSLRTLRTQKLLAIVPDIAAPFFSLVLQGIERAAAREGYSVLVADTQGQFDRDERYATMLLRREVDGLIVLSQRIPVVLKSWMDEHTSIPPVVTGFASGDEFGVSSASIDNAAMAREAMEHLYALGHQRIGVIAGPPEFASVQARLRGISDLARARSSSADVIVEHGKSSIDTGLTAGAKLLGGSERPTAILCNSDSVAIGVLEAARRLGLNVPSDLSVIGCNDIPVSAHLAPALTTMALPLTEVGYETVRLLLGALRGHINKPTESVLPFKLVHRESTAPPARN